MASARSTELVIPAASSKRMLAIDPYVEDVDELYQTIRGLAGPIVAAELRRIADKLEARFISGPIDRESAAYMLRARADELDADTEEQQ